MDPAIAATLIEQEHIIYRASCDDMTLTRASRLRGPRRFAVSGCGGAPRAPAQVRSINDTFHQRSRVPDGNDGNQCYRYGHWRR